MSARRKSGPTSPQAEVGPAAPAGRMATQSLPPRVEAKKRLGQHFLVDRHAAIRIAEAIEGKDGSTVVEIGPGMGAITGLLLERFGPRLHCLELDAEAVTYLHSAHPTLGERLHHTDCLRFDFTTLGEGYLALTGNLPYNISSQILFLTLSLRNRVREGVFMLQREVADRLLAPPGSRTYGILSVLLQAYFNTAHVLSLPPGAFAPPPKVHSSVVRLTRNALQTLPCDETLFTRVVKGAFNQRRKTLRNSLSAYFGLEMGGVPYAELRPERLDVPQFVELTHAVAQRLQLVDNG